MNVLDDLLDQLKHEIANLKTMLEPLQSGKMRMGTRRLDGPWTDTTQAWVDHLSKTIKMYQAIVDSRDASRP